MQGYISALACKQIEKKDPFPFFNSSINNIIIEDKTNNNKKDTMEGQGNITVSALKAKFDTPLTNNKSEVVGTTKKVADRNARFKPHSPPDKTNHAAKATATIQPYNRGMSATLDRKTTREETHKRLSYTKTESVSCDKSTLNGNGPSDSSSRLSMTTNKNKINIPAAFSKETPSSPTTKQPGRGNYGTSRQNSKDSNSENSLENSPKKTYGSSGSPKNLVTDKGVAMREANEIKNLGEGLVKKRAELLFQNIQGGTTTTATTKSKPSPPTASNRKNSLPKGVSMTNKGIIIRERDGKKFQLCSKNKLNTTQKCPCKPKKLESNQYQALLKQYRKTIEKLNKSGELKIEERPPSLIPELTAEEEAELEGSASSHSSTSTISRPMPPLPRKKVPSTNGSEPDQTYDDVMNTLKNEGPDDVYDDLETLECNTDNQEKKKEKEKKEQEKEEKKRKEREEKERKKQEKEEKKIRTKFKMDGTEKVVGEGTYTGESCKGGKLDLNVKKGDRINILRMQNNPAGKWLAKTEDGKVGYVESQCVEICTSNIKNVMGVTGGQYANFTPTSGFPARYGWYSLCYGVCYAPGEEENSPDDIYEEIPKCD